MSHIFGEHVMTDGKFGPTGKGHYYQPVWYHNPKARRKTGKTKWVLNQSEQYEVFQLSDDSDNRIYVENEGLDGFLDEGEFVLGENEECLAFFPEPQNEDDPWHGYPVFSYIQGLSDDQFDVWHDNDLISDLTYQRLMHKHI